jgi:fused signal recognition particle receptor
MFSFFRKKAPPPPPSPSTDTAGSLPAASSPPTLQVTPTPQVPPTPPVTPAAEAGRAPAPPSPSAVAHPVAPLPTAAAAAAATVDAPAAPAGGAPGAPPSPAPPARAGWMDRLRQGLRRTGAGIGQVFTGARIDDALYEELEAALLMADAGVKATEALLVDLKRRVKQAGSTDPAAVKGLLADAIADLLAPLQRPLQIGAVTPTVVMVVGVNGAGKTTTIGKLTRHLAAADCKVLLAAGDTFRAAAREQLAVWADRNRVEIVSQAGGDPAAVSFDAVNAGRARGCDVVIADTAGRLPTQLHLMDELKKIQRVIGKAQDGAPHEVLLVVDGNTGQNALAQVKAFDAALGLTGLVVTKLDGTAKGGVLAAIAGWCRETGRVVPVYFIGVGERLEDLQTFDAREFAQALLG